MAVNTVKVENVFSLADFFVDGLNLPTKLYFLNIGLEVSHIMSTGSTDTIIEHNLFFILIKLKVEIMPVIMNACNESVLQIQNCQQ